MYFSTTQKKQTMKIKLLITSILVTLHWSGILNAQTNDYLLNNPIWQINSQCAIPLPCIENQTYNYYTNGDTTFNSLVYKKIFKSGTGYVWTTQPPPNPCTPNPFSYVDTVPSFFLRSAAKEMFVRMPSDTNEFLLYDFNLSLGDTLPNTFNNFTNDTYVIGIDSISTPYGYLKKFELSGSSWSQYLIEGIGHSKGLIEPMHVPLECGYDLLCFSLNDSAYYPNSGPTCDLAVGLTSKSRSNNSLIFPNPSDGNSIIHFEESIQNAEIIITNFMGQIVTDFHQISGNSFRLNCENFPSGIYWVHISENQKNQEIKKLIISNP